MVLRSSKSAAAIKMEVERALPAAFKLHSELVAVHVLSHAQLRAVIERKPKGFGESPDVHHSDVIFLMGIDARRAMSAFDPREGVDTVWPGTGVVYSQRLSAERTKSRLNKVMSSPLYRSMTVRNWRTTEALLGLLEESAKDST